MLNKIFQGKARQGKARQGKARIFLVFLIFFLFSASTALAFNPFTAIYDYIFRATPSTNSTGSLQASSEQTAPKVVVPTTPPSAPLLKQGGDASITPTLVKEGAGGGNSSSTKTKIVYIQGPAGPQGPTGPVGPQGPAGTSSSYSPSFQPAFMGVIQPNPATNFSGATLFSATDLSSNHFSTSTANIANLTVSENTTIEGTLNVTGAVTMPDLTTTSLNGLTVTSSTGTLTISALKTLTANNTLTFSGTDGSTLDIGTGGTLGTNAYTSTTYLPSASFSDSGVTGKLLTGFVSGAGTVGATDSILTAINKLDGNIAGKQATLVSNSNIKTVNGTSLLGSGDITQTSVSGNAGTVTNGVYTNGSYSDPSWLTSLNATKISTGTGAVTLAAGGTNQNVTLTPSGSGYTILNGNVGVGTATPAGIFDVKGSATGLGTITTSGTAVTGTGTQFTDTFKPGDFIIANGETHTVFTINSDTSLTTETWTNSNVGVSYTIGIPGPGNISTMASGTTVTGTRTRFTSTFAVGGTITTANESHVISAIGSDTSMTTTAWTNTYTNVPYILQQLNGFTVYRNGTTNSPKLTSLRFVYEGDSITDTRDVANANPLTWPYQLPLLDPWVASGMQINTAATGDSISSMINEYATQGHLYRPINLNDNGYFLVMAGTNDWHNGRTAAQIYNDLKTEWAVARADGYKVVAFTMTPSNNGAWTGGSQAVNPLILSDPTLYDYIVRSDLVLPDPSDVTFYADGLHPTTAGYIKIAQAVSNVLHTQINNTAWGSSLILPQGGVGIKATSSLSALDVGGGVAIGSYAGSTVAPSNGLIVSGNVGIGTTSPNYTLDVNGAINATSVLINGVAVGAGGTQWASGSGGVISYTGGNVGIGTATPDARLDVSKNTAGGLGGTIKISNYNGVAANNSASLLFAANSNFSTVYSARITAVTPLAGNNSDLTFTTYGSGGEGERMRITSAGNVGIGTTGPGARLEVQVPSGTATNAIFSGLQATDTVGHYLVFNGGVAGATARGYLGYGKTGAGTATIFTNEVADYFGIKGLTGLHLGSNQATPEVTIAGGNVGIGTTGPQAQLDVSKNTSGGLGGGLVLSNYNVAAAGNTADLSFAVNSAFMSNVASARIKAITPAANNLSSLTFSTYGSGGEGERMRITDTGFVGIGMTPTHQFQLSTDDAAKPTSNTWTIVSDQRLKQNIQNFNDGLNVISQINPVSYELNGKAGTPLGAKGIGVIAQDVKDIIPYTISTFQAKLNPEDTIDTTLYDFNSSALTFVSINAIKELNLNLNGISGTITPLAGSPNESFVTAFFNNVYKKVSIWLADATNGITNIFANTFNAKDKICVDGECLTKDDVHALLLLAHPEGITTPPSAPLLNQGGEAFITPASNEEGAGGGNPTPVPETPVSPAPDSSTSSSLKASQSLNGPLSSTPQEGNNTEPASAPIVPTETVPTIQTETPAQ